MKKLICTLLCALIIISIFAAMPLTAGAETQFTYTVENGEATITGCSGSPTEIVIPAEIDGNPVTAIGKNAFFDNDDIEKVYLTEYIQLIDDNAFGDCSSLTYVAFYEGLNIIGEGAFECCENLNNVELPGTLFQIGDSAFSTCRALTDVELSQGLLTIGKYAFYECTSLKSITVPESVRTIDDYAIAYFFTGSSMGIISDFVIYGWDNSAASKYASDRNITFDYAEPPQVYMSTSRFTYTYTGKAIKPAVTVKEENGNKLVNGVDYKLVYPTSPVNVGLYSIEVRLLGKYNRIDYTQYQIAPAKNPITVKATTKTVKYSAVKKRAVTVTAITVRNAQGAVNFQRVSGSSKLSVNKKTGKITVKKGTKKGTYKVKVKVAAKGTRNYNAAIKQVTATIKVK